MDKLIRWWPSITGILKSSKGELNTISRMPDNFGGLEAVFVCRSGSSKRGGKRLIGGLLLDEITNENIYKFIFRMV